MTTLNRTSLRGSRKLNYFGGDFLQKERDKISGSGLRIPFGKRYCETCKLLKPKDKARAVKGWECADCKTISTNKEHLMSKQQSEIEKAILARGLTAPRVTPSQIESVIAAEYITTADKALAGMPTTPAMGLLTICVLVLRNGFTVIGKSACASPENFDAEIGARIAREDAVDQIWALEGYLLKQHLFDNFKTSEGEGA